MRVVFIPQAASHNNYLHSVSIALDVLRDVERVSSM